MVTKEIKIAFEEYAGINELNQTDKALCQEAVNAMETSHSPYSKFKVGVAMRLASGKIIYGSNQENVAYPSGLCAERVALFHWGANHPNDPIESMAVTAHTNDFEILNPITPCGSCLQVFA
jgi:cytidine deaminase